MLWILVLTSLALPATAAADEPRPFNPEQIRKDMARVRADLERKRAEMLNGRRNRGAAPAAAPRPLPVRNLDRGPRAHADLEYHFKTGQAFAYSVEIASAPKASGRIDCYKGSPYITVKSVDDSGEAELWIIGKLQCVTRNADGTEVVQSRRPIWIGSRIALGRSGGWVGKADINKEALPSYFDLLNLRLKSLIFPPLPRSAPYRHDTSGNGSLLMTGGSTSLIGAGFKSLDGRVTRIDHADLLEPPFVRLTDSVMFEPKPGAEKPVKIVYRAVGRFDRTRGLLRELDTIFQQGEDADPPVQGTVRIRLLEGDAMQKAYEQAVIDWQERPAVLEPFEFRRVRVDAFLPNSLESTAEARPGMEVLHIRVSAEGVPDPDSKYYLVEVVKAEPGPRGKVTIRYQGSDEVLSVIPQMLYYPISPEHPGRAQRVPKAR